MRMNHTNRCPSDDEWGSVECGPGFCLTARREDDESVGPDSGNCIHLYIAHIAHMLPE